jgi:lysine-N-methylase
MKNGRCPFLSCDGLCEIIKSDGEKALTEICREHPRFYNAIGNTLECGIGMSCPVGAELILKGDTTLTVNEDKEAGDELSSEEERLLGIILEVRESIFKDIKVKRSLKEILKKMLLISIAMEDAIFDGEMTKEGIASRTVDHKVVMTEEEKKEALLNIAEYFKLLEHLGEKDKNIFSIMYKEMKEDRISALALNKRNDERENTLKSVTEYLIYRYFTKTLYTEEFTAVAKLCAVSAVMIWLLLELFGDEKAQEVVKEYSKQIEYSPDNMEKLFRDFYSEELFEADKIIGLLQ